MRLEYFLIADSVVLDQLTRRVSIFHLIDEVVVPAFPVVLPSLATVACVEGAGRSGTHRAVLRLAGRAITEPYDLASEFSFMGERHRLTFRVENVVLSFAGSLEFELRVDGDLLAERAIPVRANESA